MKVRITVVGDVTHRLIGTRGRTVSCQAPREILALFHRDAGYARGLIKLGTIDSGLEALSTPGPMALTIELIGEE